VNEGDLTLTHGIMTKGFFAEEKSLFKGTYQSGFTINQPVVQRLYTDLSDVGWKTLCTI
jgi:hypothetical protein